MSLFRTALSIFLACLFECFSNEHCQEVLLNKCDNLAVQKTWLISDRTMREMRASLEAEKLRSVQEARREVEEDKVRCIEETKRKQWCAKCGQEALFYCCWNTAYCDYPCQQMHWPMHMRTCSQQPAFTTIVTSSSNANSQAQVMPRLVFNATSDIWKA